MQKTLFFKTTTIVIIALILLIPISMVKSKLYERQRYNEDAIQFVKTSWTAEQTFVTPVLAIGYRIAEPVLQSGHIITNRAKSERRVRSVLVDELTVQATTLNSTLQKSIYEIPVYQAEITSSGIISAEKIRRAVEAIQLEPGFNDIEEIYIYFQISDGRGIQQLPKLEVNGQSVEVYASSIRTQSRDMLQAKLERNQLTENITFSLQLSISGMKQLSFVPLAENARMAVGSNWAHPQFTGFILPSERTVTDEGFEASWSTSNISGRFNILAKYCAMGLAQCGSIEEDSVGVSFIEPVDVYLKSERAIKYAMLFIGLSFAVFYLFEVTKSIRIHPIQYTFVGLAIAIFYLLLLSLAEHVDFGLAYGCSTLACCSLLLIYLRHVLRRWLSALAFSVSLAVLYGLLFVILQAEDFAQLMGSILVFAVLATLMLVTRKLDWYQVADVDAMIKNK